MIHQDEVVDMAVDQINEEIHKRISAVSLSEAIAIMAGVAQYVSATQAGLRDDLRKRGDG